MSMVEINNDGERMYITEQVASAGISYWVAGNEYVRNDGELYTLVFGYTCFPFIRSQPFRTTI